MLGHACKKHSGENHEQLLRTEAIDNVRQENSSPFLIKPGKTSELYSELIDLYIQSKHTHIHIGTQYFIIIETQPSYINI